MSHLIEATDPAPNSALYLGRGVYDAGRAAALAGVPKSTLHYWARTNLYLPSVSPEPRTRLWSWLDLLALRAIDWFRSGRDGRIKVRMSEIRRALIELDSYEIPRHQLYAYLKVSTSGSLFISFSDELNVRAAPGHQEVIVQVIDTVSAYNSGPDLLAPRPNLQIIPGKLHGEPHLKGTRISSSVVFSLYREGFSIDSLLGMYPDATRGGLNDAIDLETSLLEHAA